MLWPPQKMSHSFIRNCCWITLQVSHHRGWKTCVKMEGETIFFRIDCSLTGTEIVECLKSLTWGVIWNSLMAWPDWPWPPYFTTDLRYCDGYRRTTQQITLNLLQQIVASLKSILSLHDIVSDRYNDSSTAVSLTQSVIWCRHTTNWNTATRPRSQTSLLIILHYVHTIYEQSDMASHSQRINSHNGTAP